MLIAADPEVVRQFAACSFEPVNPLIRVCTSHMPKGDVDVIARFRLIRMTPA